jgi:phosphomannomutase
MAEKLAKKLQEPGGPQALAKKLGGPQNVEKLANHLGVDISSSKIGSTNIGKVSSKD